MPNLLYKKLHRIDTQPRDYVVSITTDMQKASESIAAFLFSVPPGGEKAKHLKFDSLEEPLFPRSIK